MPPSAEIFAGWEQGSRNHWAMMATHAGRVGEPPGCHLRTCPGTREASALELVPKFLLWASIGRENLSRWPLARGHFSP